MQAKLVNTAGSDVDSRERTNSNDTNPGRHVKKRRAARKSLSGKTKMNTACLYYLYLSTINNYLHVLPNHKKPLISQNLHSAGTRSKIKTSRIQTLKQKTQLEQTMYLTTLLKICARKTPEIGILIHSLVFFQFRYLT